MWTRWRKWDLTYSLILVRRFSVYQLMISSRSVYLNKTFCPLFLTFVLHDWMSGAGILHVICRSTRQSKLCQALSASILQPWWGCLDFKYRWSVSFLEHSDNRVYRVTLKSDISLWSYTSPSQRTVAQYARILSRSSYVGRLFDRD